MMKFKHTLAMAGLATILGFGAGSVLAQQGNPPGGGGQGGPGGPGGQGRNFDPAQFQQRMMDFAKEQLEVKDDAEWKIIQPRIEKVMEARRTVGFGGGGMRGMFRPPRGAGGDNAQGGGGQRRGFMGPPNPDADALQKAIDAKASNAELKTALAKYQESRKAKQADLEKAQDELRKVLTLRQEAVATVNGLL